MNIGLALGLLILASLFLTYVRGRIPRPVFIGLWIVMIALFLLIGWNVR